MPSSEKEKLLEDLFRDANYEAFRAETQELCNLEFRAKRQPRSRPYLALAASLVLIGTIVFVSLNPKTGIRRPGSGAPNVTSPLAATAFPRDQLPIIKLITSVQLETVETVRSLADRNLLISTKHRDRTLQLIQSDPATVDSVNDAELFALFPNETVGFVVTPQGRKLVLIAGSGTNLQMPYGKEATH
jgi:hypothetical protein